MTKQRNFIRRVMVENSIEDDIKNAEHFIDSIKTDKEYKEENGWHGYYNKEIVELTRILEHILSDYKRVLKENELLRQQNISYKNNIHELKEARNIINAIFWITWIIFITLIDFGYVYLENNYLED